MVNARNNTTLINITIIARKILLCDYNIFSLQKRGKLIKLTVKMQCYLYEWPHSLHHIEQSIYSLFFLIVVTFSQWPIEAPKLTDS